MTFTSSDLLEMVDAFEPTSRVYRGLRQAASDREDAERWRWLVAENNKGPMHAKFVICWFSKDGDGYETTSGVSVNGFDIEAIVRIIDQARQESRHG